MNQPNNQPQTAKVVLAFATVYIVWGSTYFFIQRALNGFPPMMLGAIRFLLAGFIMLGWAVARRENIFHLRAIKTALPTGVMLLFVGNGIVIWVEQFMPSAMVAIIIASAPVWFIVFDRPLWHENFRSVSTITGLILGFGGVVLLFGEKIAGLGTAAVNLQEAGGILLVLAGSMSWAAGSLYAKYRPVKAPASVTTSWQMLWAGLAFVPASLIHGEYPQFNMSAIPLSSWLSLAYLVFFGSIAGYSAYVWLLKVRPTTQVSTYAYVNPVVAVLLGVLFAGEKVTLLQITGLAVILLSVFLINLVKYRREKVLQRNAARRVGIPT